MIRGLVAVVLSVVPLIGACDRLAGSASGGCEKDSDCKGDRICQSGQCVAPAGATAATSATATAASDGTDPKNPVLAPDDAAFADTRHGWGWSDRSWKELHDRKFGWALAACEKGLDLPDLDPKAKAALVYNQGLAHEGGGDRATAKSLFEQSLALRPPNDPGRAEVAAALARVGGAPAPVAPTGQAPGLPQHTPFGPGMPAAPKPCGLNNQICGHGQRCCKDGPNGAAGWGCHSPNDPNIGICEP
jgi:hypothetical protein